MDPVSGYCYGCGRSNEEKRIWKEESTTDDWKSKNIEEIQTRLNGWQLESFKESYNNKKKRNFIIQKTKIKMRKSDIVIVIYVVGLLFGALVLDLWEAETSPKSLLGIIWTAIFLIFLFYSEKKNIQ